MKKTILWALGGILGTIIVALLGVVLFFVVMIGNIGQKTVVQVLPSPDGTYEARVIDVDQGALGGDTVVEVERKGFLTRPKRIYIGEWGEWETMEIYWKDETTLVINGVWYDVG